MHRIWTGKTSYEIEPKAKTALDHLSKNFIHFSRNGRWGTCVACPVDSHGMVYPEFCEHTNRYDHTLTAQELADTWSNYTK